MDVSHLKLVALLQSHLVAVIAITRPRNSILDEFLLQNQMGQVKFRKLLAQNLIYNTHYNEISDKTPDKWKQHETGYCLITLPEGEKFSKI